MYHLRTVTFKEVDGDYRISEVENCYLGDEYTTFRPPFSEELKTSWPDLDWDNVRKFVQAGYGNSSFYFLRKNLGPKKFEYYIVNSNGDTYERL